MKHYLAERKEALLRQMMPPMNQPISELTRENGIAEQTLYTWRRNLKARGVPVPGNGKHAQEWSSKDKFGVVLEAAGLNETELAEYWRRKGRPRGCDGRNTGNIESFYNRQLRHSRLGKRSARVVR